MTDYRKYYDNCDSSISLCNLELKDPIKRHNTFKAPSTFNFLNIEHAFDNQIDWNFNVYGKLWTYNLNYFDFINQNEIQKKDALQLIRNYVQSESTLKDGKEPYPVSLRLINWLKFLQINKIDDQEINGFVLGDLKNLADNLEYHLQGNHLLENAFALTIGGHCLKLDKFYKKGKSLLINQLAKQICNDGAHYELSPMYHQIILYRLLDTINFLGKENAKELLPIADKMLSWLDNITFKDGDIPMLSDSAPGIAPTSSDPFDYAKRLGINYTPIRLSDSGLRYYNKGDYECIVDGGGLGPEYHTGHGHSDAGTFIMKYKGDHVVVDTGISTYEENERRLLEKSVLSHNTTHPKDVEPSEMWKSFRVARRERVFIKNECEKSVEIERNLPYKNKDKCIRSFTFEDHQIKIFDHCETNRSEKTFYAYIHFAPNVKVNLLEDGVIDFKYMSIKISGANQISKASYLKANGYNNLVESNKLIIEFEDKLKTEINFKTVH